MRVPREPLVDRDAWILARCSGRSVLHVGCTDMPFTDRKLGEQSLLHQRLLPVCRTCVGLDCDQGGLDTLARALPGHEFLCADAERLDRCAALADRSFDVVLAADMLEHLANPGSFIDGVKRHLARPDGELIITTPNAFSLKRFLAMALRGVEHVHADHTAYFSHSTLSQLLRRAGYALDSVHPFQWRNPGSLRNGMANLVTAPLVHLSGGRLADELAIVARPLPAG